MPRANRYFLPGHVWHITHRCGPNFWGPAINHYNLDGEPRFLIIRLIMALRPPESSHRNEFRVGPTKMKQRMPLSDGKRQKPSFTDEDLLTRWSAIRLRLKVWHLG
jgi:hypothetical protein